MNDFNQQVTEHLRGIVKATQNEISATRSKILSEIPKFSLNKIHCDSASLVLNRNELIKKMAPNGIVAELGADSGKFSLEIVNVANPKKFIIVDAWNTERYGDDKAKGVAELFDEKINTGQVEIIRSLSVPAAEQFAENYFDWIYIDTDHSYKTTLSELHAYERTIKNGGYICGHDYVMGNWASGYKYGVIEAVAEFCVTKNWKIAYLTADFTENNSFAICKI